MYRGLFLAPRSKLFLVMKLTFFFLVIGLLEVHASAIGQVKVVNLDVKDMTLRHVFDELKRQTDLDFFFSNRELDMNSKVTIQVQKTDLMEVLSRLLGREYQFELLEGMVIIKPVFARDSVQVKSITLRGFVQDEKNQPMPGVTIQLAGTAVGTATDAHGKFAVKIPMLKGKLEFSFVGYKKQIVEFTEKTAKDTIRVTLQEEVVGVDEVVVRAYGTQNRKEVVSAISSIKAEDMKELPTANLMNMLQGRVAGLNIINQSGAPGSASVVAIRGFNSLLTDGASDGSPLYVVDGVPMHSFVSPVTGTNTMADIDPSMIESVEVLKDASAASIYGSRAGNGVILITTKKGRVGETKFSANVSYTASRLMASPLQTGGRLERWWEIQNMRHYSAPGNDNTIPGLVYPMSHSEAYKKFGEYDKFWGNGHGKVNVIDYLQDSLNPFFNNQTNWWDYAFRKGEITNANLQASGGSKRFTYMMGAGWFAETGIMNSSSYQRINVMANLSATPSEKLRMDMQLYGAYVDRSRNTRHALNHKRFEHMTVQPTKQSTLYPASQEGVDAWLDDMNKTVDKSDDLRGMGSIYLEYKLFKGLTFSAKGSVDYSQGNRNTFTPSDLDKINHENKSEGNIMRSIAMSNEELLRYKLTLNEQHNFELLLGFNVERNQTYTIGGWGKGGASDYVYYYNPDLSVDVKDYGMIIEDWRATRSYSSSFTEKAMVSYFGRFSYNWKQRYLMEFTFRRDGSSTFGEANKWANFPSLGLGWAFSQESFMKWANFLDWGKLRASYGTSGQVFNDPYMAHGLMRVVKGPFQGESGITAGSAISPDLTWEKSEQYNIGLDLDMLNYRLKVKLDYYYKLTSSLIYSVPLPETILLVNKRTENAMEVSNEGIELELEADILREGPISWRMKFNASRNWNRFEKSYSKRDEGGMVIGRPLFGIYVYDAEGFYNSEDEVPVYYDIWGNKKYFGGVSCASPMSGKVGTYKIKDLNGDNMINGSDMYYAGTPQPKAHGGWVNEIRWKNFDLSMLFNYELGRKMINAREYTISTGPKFVDIANLSYWEKPGDHAKLARMGTATDVMMDSNIENVHAISLKQITLGCDLPAKWAKKISLKGARMFFTVENLFYLSNYSGANPEVIDVYKGVDFGIEYPLPRKMTVGLTLNF